MSYPSRAYVVASTQRSGSTYLCQLLASTGVAGNPQEYFEARAETGSPPHPGYFLAGLPRTGAGIRDDQRPTDAPDYSDLGAVDAETGGGVLMVGGVPLVVQPVRLPDDPCSRVPVPW